MKLAGQIRDLMESERAERGSCEPFTLTALDAAIGVGPERLLDAIKLLSLVSWRMQREGDSKPVEVWGTEVQFREHVQRAWFGHSDEDVAEFCGAPILMVIRARAARS